MKFEANTTTIQPNNPNDMAYQGTEQNYPLNKPGEWQVIRRNGKLTRYDDSKITVAITKAFLAVEGSTAATSNRIHDTATKLTTQITSALKRRAPSGGVFHIEDIQDQVELFLMRAGEQKVARAYVLYRESHNAQRKVTTQKNTTQKTLHTTLPDGSKKLLDTQRLETVVKEACAGLENVSIDTIIKEAKQNLFDGIQLSDVNKALIMAARTHVEKEPEYTYATARLLLDDMRSEALKFLGVGNSATHEQMTQLYPDYFEAYIKRGVELDRLNPELLAFDLKKIAGALNADRDLQFTYLGLQTLYDRYFIHQDGIRYELPQAFFMRVAMGLSLNEKEKELKTIEFYNTLSTFTFMSATPTLFNSGTTRSQLSSCYLTTVDDDLDGIYGAIKDNALLSKFAGGLGNDWTPVRAMGAHIKGTNGKSQGIIPFLNVANASTGAVNQGGKRKGAACAYLETWHLDIEEFLELRKNTGDDRRRTHDMNTANWIPDLFLKRVFNNEDWSLFSPDETPDLHNLYGEAFEEAYHNYERKAQRGEIKNYKTISAVTLWRKMLGLLFETGHPWITFKDACNLRSPQQHAGVVHSSNLCTEITLNTSKDEIAVCNLGSINLPAHITDKKLDKNKLEKTINTAIRMLDNVIDINFYPVPQAANSNKKHRPIGLGMMGFQDVLHKLDIPYASDEAVSFADTSAELFSYYAIKASSDLAKERGTYETYEGSLWSQGILPIDSIQILQKSRGKYLEQNTDASLDWETLRKQIKSTGIRNSNVMAIAPTATISNICGVTQSIEPTYQNLFVKSNLSGEFTVVNKYLVEDLKNLNIWDDVMINDLKYYDGSLLPISRIPQELKQKYATAFEIEPRWLIEAASRRQKWLDQGQSLNIYMSSPSGKKLDTVYRMAWLRGLKTTYYLRTLGATSTEKSTINDGALNAVRIDTPTVKACSIDDPECESCQ